MTALPIRAALNAIPDPQDFAVPDMTGLVNLAGNELPSPATDAVIQAIAETAGLAHQYPQPDSADLTRALGRHHQTDPIGVVVGNGSANVLLQLLSAVCEPGDAVAYSSPGFEAYPHLVRLARGTPAPVPLRDHAEDLGALLATIKRRRARAAFVCNPFNPTGSITRAEELEVFLDDVPEDVLVVLDEAYHEFVTDPEVPNGVALAARGRWDNLAAVRTFSKAFALGGARVGYAVTSPALAAAARKCGVLYSVNRFAQGAGCAALATAEHLLPTHELVRNERDALRGELRELGYGVPASHANFLWLPLGERAAEFHAHCRSHKVLVRLFAGHGARVTIGTPQDNIAFLAAARTFPRPWAPIALSRGGTADAR